MSIHYSLFPVLPLMLDCSVDAESIICTSNNELDTNKTLCSFNDDTAVPCEHSTMW